MALGLAAIAQRGVMGKTTFFTSYKLGVIF